MRDNSLLVICLVIIACIMVFGGNLGLSYSGTIDKPESNTEQPGLLNLFDWIWTGVGFYFQIISFSVPDMPYWVSLIFLIITLIPLVLLLKFVRGTGT